MKQVSALRQGQEMCNSYKDCSSHNCVKTWYKDWKSGTHTLHGQFFSLDLFNNLLTKTINFCGTFTPSQKGMPSDFGMNEIGQYKD
jgi:hypothetical protein